MKRHHDQSNIYKEKTFNWGWLTFSHDDDNDNDDDDDDGMI